MLIELSKLKEIYGLENKRTRWCIIEERDDFGSHLYLGIQPIHSKVAVKLCEKRFVTEITWKQVNFSRRFYSAQKKVKSGRVIFQARKKHCDSSEEILEISRHANFLETYLSDMVYSPKMESQQMK
jgi:hypothetical protein